MRQFLGKLWPFSSKTIQFPVELLTDSEAMERFNAVSQFILESQKQMFESLRFSLNVWFVLNSGAAIALAQKISPERYNSKEWLVCFLGFVLGALMSAVGLVNLCFRAKKISTILMCFTVSKTQMYMALIADLKKEFESTFYFLRHVMMCSYLLFYFCVCFIVLKESGFL